MTIDLFRLPDFTSLSKRRFEWGSLLLAAMQRRIRSIGACPTNIVLGVTAAITLGS